MSCKGSSVGGYEERPWKGHGSTPNALSKMIIFIFMDQFIINSLSDVMMLFGDVSC